jgi:hypothetical protein
VLLFAAVPFVVYLATRRRVLGFADYLGLFRPTGSSVTLATALALLLFGLVHPLLLSAAAASLTADRFLFLFLAPTATGWRLGYLKDRPAIGSLVPCWWVHGLANTLAFALIAYWPT